MAWERRKLRSTEAIGLWPHHRSDRCAVRRSMNGPTPARKAPCEIVAVSSEEPHPIAVAPRHDAEAVVLDFVNPIRSGRRPIGGAGKAGLNEVG